LKKNFNFYQKIRSLKMKRYIYLALATFAAMIIFVGCEKGPEPIPIESLDTHTDPVTKFEVKYPSNWKTAEQTQRFVVYSDPQVSKRFTFRGEYSQGFPGAKIDMMAMDMDSLWTLDSVMAKSMMFDKEIYQKENVTFGGKPGYKLTYAFELDGGPFMGEMYMAIKDTGKATVLIFEAFDGTMDMYKPKFDEIANSVVLASLPKTRQPGDTIFQEVEADPPTDNLSTKRGDGFTIGIPDNFYKNNVKTAPSAEKSYFYWGDRRGDSFIRVDIFDASEQKDLSKIVEENKSKYGNNSAQNAKLGGKDAKRIDYSASSTVKGRVYFVVSGDKLYRVTINWFTEEESDYLPPFEKSVNSIKF
jgi:hypothetical protein